QHSENTARKYESAVVRFLDEIGDRELQPDVLVEYTQSLHDLAPSSQAAHISAARSFLRVAQSQGLIPRSPVEWLRRPKVQVSPYGKWLDLDELSRLAAAARQLGPTYVALLALLWTTGLRVSEAAGARWCDLYADTEGRIGLRVMHAKGGKE